MEGSKGRRYAREFIEEAVRLARDGGKSRAEIARDLGVSQESLRRWTLLYDDRGHKRAVPGAEERAEIARLRRELRVVTEEREILKKAAAFFAQAANRNQ